VSEPQQRDPADEEHLSEGEKHHLLIWTSLARGDVVSLQGNNAQTYGGIIESKTSDGLIIWIRDELNDRKLVHVRDCRSVHVIQ
jgi:hypothetical protein